MILEAAADWGLSERPRALAAAWLAGDTQGLSPPRCPRHPQPSGGSGSKACGLRGAQTPVSPSVPIQPPLGSSGCHPSAREVAGTRQAPFATGKAGLGLPRPRDYSALPFGVPGSLGAWQRCQGQDGAWEGCWEPSLG